MNSTEEIQNLQLVDRLIALHKDRGAIAHLRKYWSPATRYPYTVPYLGKLGILGEEPNELTAAIFAEHCRQKMLHQVNGPTLGSALLALGGGSTQADGFNALERHFRRLLACESLTEAGDQIFRLAKRFQRKDIKLDYNKLNKNLWSWQRGYSNDVKTTWAMQFWNAHPEESQIPN